MRGRRERSGGRVHAARRPLTWIVLLALLLGSSYASAARARIKVRRPVAEVCSGQKILLGVLRIRPRPTYRVRVFDPSGRLMWSRKGTATKRWQNWKVTLRAEGPHRIIYNGYRRSWTFQTDVPRCEDESKVNLSIGSVQAAVLSLPNAAPGDATEGCVPVSYSGSLPARVRLYGRTDGTGLDAYLDLTVTRGTGPASADGSCEGFVADAEDPLGAGSGVVFRGTLRDFPDDWTTGVVDPATWTNGDVRLFKLRVELTSSTVAQGLSASQSFVWEARDP